MEPDEPDKKTRERPAVVTKARRRRLKALPHEEKGTNLVEAPPWLLSGLYLVCHSCHGARWTTNDAEMSPRFEIFKHFHGAHNIEFMGAVRFLSDFLGKTEGKPGEVPHVYSDIDRPNLRPIVTTFGEQAPRVDTPAGCPGGVIGSLEVQRRMQRQHEKRPL